MSKLLNYRVVGEGHPVVFLHGFLESVSMWKYLDLSGFKQVLIDLPGHGGSKHCKDEISMAEAAELVKEVLDSLDIKEYDLVGHSMGGYVGLELVQMDERCQKLVLLNSNFWADDRNKQRDRNRVARIVAANKMIFLYEAIPNLFLDPESYDKEIKVMIEEAESIDSVVVANASISMSKRKDLSDVVRKEHKRILVIQGDQDAVVSTAKMRQSKEDLGFHYLEIPSCGHMAHIEKPETVEEALRNFLK